MYCRNCGKFHNDQDAFCRNCGAKIIYDDIKVVVKEEKKKEKVSVGWWFLAFFFPLIGFILFFVYRKKRPRVGKRLIVGTIVGFVVGVVSIAIIVAMIISYYFSGLYFNLVSKNMDGLTYTQSVALKLYDEDQGRGDFIISSDEIYNYYGEYEDIFDGDVNVEVAITCVGEWQKVSDDDIKLVTYQMFVKYDFSGEGAENYINSLKFEYEIIYGYSITKQLLNEEEVIFNYDKGKVSYLTLNHDERTFIEKDSLF